MSKRFVDTDIWKREWFCALSPTMKTIWKYLCDNCDNAGIWQINIGLLCYQVGTKTTVQDIMDIFKDHLKMISNTKILVCDFIEFQYGTIKEGTSIFKHIMNLVKKHGLSYPIDRVSIGYIEGIDTLQDKDMDMDQDKDKEGECEGKLNMSERFSVPTLVEVKDYCKLRGNKIDPSAFIAFYESKGWRVGNQPMKKWQAAIITWEKRDNGRGGNKIERPPANRFPGLPEAEDPELVHAAAEMAKADFNKSIHKGVA